MMKKTILLMLTACTIAADGFCQTACPPADTINLVYDTCSRRILKPKHDGLANKTTYVFRILGVNSALYTTRISAANITRAPALPTVLGGLNGNNSTPKIENARAFAEGPDFFLKMKLDYNALKAISDSTTSLLAYLSNHAASTESVHQQTLKTLAGIKTAVEPTGMDPAALDHLKDFKALVSSLLTDFGSRTSLVFSPKTKLADSLSLDNLLAVKKADTVIRKASAFLLNCPDILYAIKNSTGWIASGPYQATADYFQFNVTLLKPKFADKPDTVSFNKINFYRTHYWKAIDVSTGFFFDNLASKAYYFKNTVPAQEIQSSADVSIGALFNSYWVFDSGWKAGPCAGIGVSLLDAKSKYFIGGSLLIGKKNEFAISVGYALASLPKVSNLYNTNTLTTTTTATAGVNATGTTVTIGTTPSTANTTTTSTTTTVTTTNQPIGTTGTVNTYNKYQGGFFVGITYSFLKF